MRSEKLSVPIFIDGLSRAVYQNGIVKIHQRCRTKHSRGGRTNAIVIAPLSEFFGENRKISIKTLSVSAVY